jgi:cob(I)alamin adenosyltransferase
VKIYTRRGDSGATSLRAGVRAPKTDFRVEACGACDEAGAAIGLAVSLTEYPELRAILLDQQSALLSVGAAIAAAGDPCRPTARGPALVAALESAIDNTDAELPPLTSFILPGGTPAASALHLARTICRRAERVVVAASAEHAFEPWVLAYMNRLSDLLFVLARAANARSGTGDVVWRGDRAA